jgi:hypothetical protein
VSERERDEYEKELAIINKAYAINLRATEERRAQLLMYQTFLIELMNL